MFNCKRFFLGVLENIKYISKNIMNKYCDKNQDLSINK